MFQLRHTLESETRVPFCAYPPDELSIYRLRMAVFSDPHVTYFYDTRLPFGAKNSPEILNRITQSVHRMMARRGFSGGGVAV